VIAAELNAMSLDSNEKEIGDIVHKQYFFGFSVIVTITDINKYSLITDAIGNAMYENIEIANIQNVPIKLQAVRATNFWKSTNNSSIIRGAHFHAIAGSRKSNLPCDNVLFTLEIHTQESFKLKGKIKKILEMDIATSGNVVATIEKAFRLCKECPVPSNADVMSCFSKYDEIPH
jgi:hypothetical protein